jgi:hypothetical protein
MRRASESLNPEIEANTQIATINFENEVILNLQKHPDIAPYLAPGTTYDEFLTNYLQLSTNYSPVAKRDALVETMKAEVDPVTNAPFTFNADATIAGLPVSDAGSSPQQNALRDALMNLNTLKDKLTLRLERAKERRAELLKKEKDLVLTSEVKELDKLNSSIPLLERILILKDYGVDSQIKRVEGKIGGSWLWDATPGATYFVPPDVEADDIAVRGSTAKIPANFSFDNESRRAFLRNMQKQVAWLKNEANKES